MRQGIVIVFILLCIVLAIQNSSTVTFNVFKWYVDIQKGLLILIFAILGYLLGLNSRGK